MSQHRTDSRVGGHALHLGSQFQRSSKRLLLFLPSAEGIHATVPEGRHSDVQTPA